MVERKLAIEQLKEGMLISADVHNSVGVVIVPANTMVTGDVLKLLARHSVLEVMVGEKSDDIGFSLEDLGVLDNALGMLDYLEERENKQESFEDTFRGAVKEIKEFFERLLAHQETDIYRLLDIVATVVEKADNNVNLFQMLYKKMNRETEDIYEHCINVSLYAQMLAKWVDLSAEEVELAGIAGALHDVGLIVCHKQGEKDITMHGEYENACGFNHMIHSYNLIKNMDVDLRLKQAILTHHERMDLSGFPNRLSYKNLNHVSRVVAIADAFATLTMKEDGVEGMMPLDALCHMFDTGYIKFDTEFLVRFIEHVVQNFIQYEVLLSNGQRGKIVMPSKREPARPLIMLNDGGFVDLSARKDISVTEMFY